MGDKRPWNYKDLTGQRFGRLVCIKEIEMGNTKTHWLCKCDCGNEKITNVTHLTKGICRSCGCLHKDRMKEVKFKHGMLGTSEYMAWLNLKRRCYEKSNPRYNTYGERGITVCDRWLDKERGFLNFLEDVGKKPYKDYSIERVDNNLGYSPENCCWVKNVDQAKNKSNARILELDGVDHSLTEWSEITGIDKRLIFSRLKLGWSVKDALTKPVRKLKRCIDGTER